MLTQFFKTPLRLKTTQKCVRQTFLQIINYLNEKYQFANPIKIEHKRSDYRRKEDGKKTTDTWLNYHSFKFTFLKTDRRRY